jgi:hypothetical protein
MGYRGQDFSAVAANGMLEQDGGVPPRDHATRDKDSSVGREGWSRSTLNGPNLGDDAG